MHKQDHFHKLKSCLQNEHLCPSHTCTLTVMLVLSFRRCDNVVNMLTRFSLQLDMWFFGGVMVLIKPKTFVFF